jgi:hypothetical protein
MTAPNADSVPLCYLSFARPPFDHTYHTYPIEHPDWAFCKACGEVLNIRGSELPEHIDRRWIAQNDRSGAGA